MSFLVQKTEAKPRAVVLLFGWLGAEIRHVQKYADLYTNCATVTGVCNPFAVMTGNWAALDRFVMEGVNEVTTILKDNKDVPVIVHCFSNGGAFCVYRLRFLLQKAEKQKQPLFELGAELFDSAPVFVSHKAIREASKKCTRKLVVSSAVYIAACTTFVLTSAASLLKGKDPEYQAFWKSMKEDRSRCPQGYIYSTVDSVADHTKIDELIAYRNSEYQVDISVLKFTDSPHVDHLRSHPSKYLLFVESMVFKASSKALKSNSVPSLNHGTYNFKLAEEYTC